MKEKLIDAAEFAASCLKIIEDKLPVTITRRGVPVARLTPVDECTTKRSIIGAMKGSVLRYDEPFAPAGDASGWSETT